MGGRIHTLNYFLWPTKRLQSIIIRFVNIIPVIDITLRINAIAVIHQFEFRSDTLIYELPCAVFRTIEILFNLHVVHKVQIDFLRKIHHHAAHEICAVQHDVQMSCKTKRFGIERHESQVYTRLPGNSQSVHKIILIE